MTESLVSNAGLSNIMSSNVFQRGLSRISRRKKKTRALPVIQETEHPTEQEVPDVNLPAKPSLLGRGMDRLRRSIRQSFRRKKSPERLPAAELVGNTSSSSSSKHDQWQPDEGAVRAGLCSFNVKYLGAVEVFEARGMQVCEGALKMLRNTRRRPVKAVLYVSGDGLRVVDQQNNRGLIVDQTIEKVSFCAPDRNNDKGFAYICRDGTSRRWMCHGFSSSKDSGERLSHAVGCAFAICLERKKKRDEESTVSVEKALHPDWGQAPSTAGTAAASSSSNATMSDSDSGSHRANPAYQSFRKQISIKDRLQDPQSAIVNECPQRAVASTSSIAKPRPAPNPALFQRQGSLRAPDSSNTAQFRRNLSLRSNSLENTGKTQRVPFGQMMHNEPIYEGDEAETTETVHATSLTAPSTMSHSLYGTLSSNFSPPDANTTSPFNNGVSSSTSNNLISTTSATNSQSSQWSTFDSSGGKVGSGGVSTSKLINVDTQINGATPSQSSSSRNKADEWLNGALQTSLSFSSPPQTAQVTPTFSGHALPGGATQPTAGTNSAPSPYSLLDGSLLSGPPPSYAPPPLPTKQAVANGNTNTPFTSSPSPQPVDMFGQAVQWDTVPTPLPPKPVDPFDVQWSRLAISGNNPFASEHTSSGREVSI